MIMLCILILVLAGKSSSVCLKGTIEKGILHLHCKVDLLIANVEIYGPDKNLYGSCFGPTRLSDRHVVCDQERNITQNITTNVTTVVTRESSSFSIYGQWICKHGTGLGNDTLVVTRTILADDCVCDVIPTLVTVICGIILLEALGYVLYKRCIKWRRNEKMDENGLPDEEQPLVNEEKPLFGPTTTGNECRKCKMLSVCAICANCEDFYCEVCCDAHTQIYPEHNVCLIEHVVKSRSEVKCKRCGKNDPTLVCTKCKKLFCNDCTCEHTDSSVKLSIVSSRGKPVVRVVSECSSVHQLKCTIYLPSNDSKPNRVCGLCYLNDGMIVVADINNEKLKVFKTCMDESYELSQTVDLPCEPRGMAHMFENQVAVTFAYIKEIHIFDISDNVTTLRVLPLKDIGKPYSIAYNAAHFAVVVGESEDGFIAILDSNGKLTHNIPNKEFAYFTGNTIRLALDKTKGRLFISALSKKTVCCVDLDANIQWKVSIPSPRGILFLPGIQLENKNLILASKRHDTVYEMSSKDGSTGVLISGTITGPRYMTYNFLKKLLCVQVDDNKLLVYNYEIK